MDTKGCHRILVVDREWGTPGFPAQPLKAYFGRRKRNYRFEGRRTAAEALKAVRGGDPAPDLILLDIHLTHGGREGFEVLRAMKAEGIEIPVVVLSRDEEPQDLKRSLATYGGYDVLDYLDKDRVLGKGGYAELEALIETILWDSGKFRNETGILITHGTDTMAWGFSILRYALKGLRMNIAITGSQLPLAGFFSPSDAIGNLKTSLYLLARLRPPSLFAVFNNGRTVFSANLQKVSKWDHDAFSGRVMGRMVWEQIRLSGERGQRKLSLSADSRSRLKRLFLFRTGGTIESVKDPVTGALQSTGDAFSGYLLRQVRKEFAERVVTPRESLARDSSTMSRREWLEVADWIADPGVADCRVDKRFDWSVKVVLANPFFTSRDYLNFFQGAEGGIVLLAYGAGNANVDPRSPHSILPALIWARVQGKIVVVSSQVPLETYDFEYEAGRRLLEYGALPSGALSYPEAQVKLAYILGHKQEIQRALARYPQFEETRLIKSAFLAGVEFRTEESRKEYLRLVNRRQPQAPLKILPHDPFSDPGKTFAQALEEVAGYLAGER